MSPNYFLASLNANLDKDGIRYIFQTVHIKSRKQVSCIRMLALGIPHTLIFPFPTVPRAHICIVNINLEKKKETVVKLQYVKLKWFVISLFQTVFPLPTSLISSP